jgi:predicted MFS family arabinose efflux permease
VWIPTPLYEAIPAACIALGAALIGAAYLSQGGAGGLLLGLGVLAAMAGVLLWMKRRGYRKTRSDYDPGSLDE